MKRVLSLARPPLPNRPPLPKPSALQVQEEYEEELAALRQQHEAALADERRRAADATQAALEAHRAELESLAAQHEEQVGWRVWRFCTHAA